MKRILVLAGLGFGWSTVGAVALVAPATAAVCASGVYRAGCAGPNGAVVVRKPPPPRQQTVKCANGVYRAGCVGPNGAAAVKKDCAGSLRGCSLASAHNRADPRRAKRSGGVNLAGQSNTIAW